MIIVESMADELLLNPTAMKEYYVTGCKVKVKFYRDCLHVVDLTNALKVGKYCTWFYIRMEQARYNDGFPCLFYNWLQDNRLSFMSFIEGLLSDFDFAGLQVEKSVQKGINTYSPFEKVKKIAVPKKWTLQHVWKALLANQIESARCIGRYTDDYAYDAAVNFQIGELSHQDFAKDLIEDPSGWWVISSPLIDGKVKLSVSCHHFNNNELIFNPVI